MDQPERAKLTYQDYASWEDDKRWELIDGEPFLMSPAPRIVHQRLVTKLSYAISSRLSGTGCEAFVSPIDVKFSESDVLQPDVVVGCDPTQIKERFIAGPPTLVVEVLSPSSLRHDRLKKLQTYARFGVAEYWIVTPEPPLLEVLTLDQDKGYRISGTYTERDTLTSSTLPELSIPLEELFGSPREYPDEVREGTPPIASTLSSS